MNSLMKICGYLFRGLDGLTVGIGKTIAWLTVVMVITTTGIVAYRHLFEAGSVGVQESVTYMHALIIMLASAYTLRENAHVRVDIFYRRFSVVQRAWVDLLGSVLFLLPLAIATIFLCWEFVTTAWANKEGSADAGGIPAVYILKSLLLINGIMLALQALAETCRNLCTLTLNEAA